MHPVDRREFPQILRLGGIAPTDDLLLSPLKIIPRASVR
jgi:hypothetical protein